MNEKENRQVQIDNIQLEIARLEMEMNFAINDLDNEENCDYSHIQWYIDELATLYCELELLEKAA